MGPAMAELPVSPARGTLYYYSNVIGVILGLYRDNGKENGNYYNVIGVILGLYRDIAKKRKLL